MIRKEQTFITITKGFFSRVLTDRKYVLIRDFCSNSVLQYSKVKSLSSYYNLAMFICISFEKKKKTVSDKWHNRREKAMKSLDVFASMDAKISKNDCHWLINFVSFECHENPLHWIWWIVRVVDEYVEYIDQFLSHVREDELEQAIKKRQTNDWRRWYSVIPSQHFLVWVLQWFFDVVDFSFWSFEYVQ